ncbi:hypothetical protein, partial [Pasteurella multocida]|uniref:hypothetical protein n=1 Tax=Pasteurella multocida TaxID=747 RepID=UPI0014613491
RNPNGKKERSQGETQKRKGGIFLGEKVKEDECREGFMKKNRKRDFSEGVVRRRTEGRRAEEREEETNTEENGGRGGKKQQEKGRKKERD